MTPYQQAECIAAETNIKTLEIYRSDSLSQREARMIDSALADLSTRIILALGLVPVDTEDRCARCEITDLKPIENESVLDPGVETNTQESQTTEQEPHPDVEPAPVHKAETKEASPTEPDSGGEVVSKETKKPKSEQKPTKKDKLRIDNSKHTKRVAYLIDWMAREDLSQTDAAKRVGVSSVTICSLLSGKSQGSEDTWKKILKAAKPKKKPVNNTPATPKNSYSKRKTNGPAPLKSNSKGPGQFVQMKFMTWLGAEKLGVAGAAKRLHVKESVIRSIMSGTVQSKATLTTLGKHIPEIYNNMGFLLSQINQGIKTNGHGTEI